MVDTMPRPSLLNSMCKIVSQSGRASYFYLQVISSFPIALGSGEEQRGNFTAGFRQSRFNLKNRFSEAIGDSVMPVSTFQVLLPGISYLLVGSVAPSRLHHTDQIHACPECSPLSVPFFLAQISQNPLLLFPLWCFSCLFLLLRHTSVHDYLAVIQSRHTSVHDYLAVQMRAVFRHRVTAQPLVFVFLFRATLEAYGNSQARGGIRAAPAGLHHGHSRSNARSELHL